MTEKLFYEDSHMITFSAIVEACEKVGEHYEAVLSRTAFFPEGGGQYADTGVIDGVHVFDVHERKGLIYHYLEAPLTVGECVEGKIDWEERFSKMQNHSGEHIISGLVHKKFGYDNVGFHMGKDAITMDFNGVISKEELKELELQANSIVFQNIPIETLYPTKVELESIVYRSKIEIEGQVRIVRIADCDVCACCAPHCKMTGEIGTIKLVGMQNYKGGVRISMLAGYRALEDYETKSENVKRISVMLSAKEHEIADEVQKLKEELLARKNQLHELQRELLKQKVDSMGENQEVIVMFESELEGNGPRELTNLILSKGTKVAAVFAGEGPNYRYVIGSRDVDTRIVAKTLNEKFSGRGGGKPEMVQGSVTGDEKCVREEVLAWCKKI